MARKPASIAEETKPEDEVIPTVPFGDPMNEFASVAIRHDHLANLEGKTVAALIMSTETAPEAVLALMAYHNRFPTVQDTNVLSLGSEVACAYLLHVNERMSYTVIDRAAWDEVQADPMRGNGTDLETVAVFTAISTELQKRAKNAGVPKSALLVWSSED